MIGETGQSGILYPQREDVDGLVDDVRADKISKKKYQAGNSKEL
jgi:hypothetical protein